MSFTDSFKMSLDLMWTILTAEPLLTITLLTFFGVSLLLIVVLNVIAERRLRKSGILEVDKMTGRKFEEYLQALLRGKGYSVQLTPASGDYGADLIITKNGEKIIVQAKRYKKNVGVKAVQEIAAAKNYYKADQCWVITNSFFTEPARKLANTNQVRLIDRKQLMDWMLKENKDQHVSKVSVG